VRHGRVLYTLTHNFTITECTEALAIASISLSPPAGSGVVIIDPLRFLAGCRARRLNQALSVLSLMYRFLLSRCVLLLTIGPLFMLCYFCVFLCVFCLLVVLVRLSVPVQVIDCMEKLVSEMTYNVLVGTLNPTHSFTPSVHLSVHDRIKEC